MKGYIPTRGWERWNLWPPCPPTWGVLISASTVPHCYPQASTQVKLCAISPPPSKQVKLLYGSVICKLANKCSYYLRIRYLQASKHVQLLRTHSLRTSNQASKTSKVIAYQFVTYQETNKHRYLLHIYSLHTRKESSKVLNVLIPY